MPRSYGPARAWRANISGFSNAPFKEGRLIGQLSALGVSGPFQTPARERIILEFQKQILKFKDLKNLFVKPVDKQ